jgi:3',5'-cyclic AMP phosphodiesterase CpdA
MKRRQFIKSLSVAFFLINGKTILASDLSQFEKKKLALRFVVLSDGHFGQPKTNYQEFYDIAIDHVNKQHTTKPFDFGVMNGDIIHDNVAFLGEAKKSLDNLKFPYYVTKGNHDIATPQLWESTWKMPLNYDVVVNDHVLLFGNTSNEKGEYLPPDMQWLSSSLKKYEKAENIFLFLHIPPIKWTSNAVSSLEFQDLVKQYKNIKGVFHGHEHDQDGIKWQDGIPYLFDSHIGGNWGTTYKGFRIVEVYKDGSMLTYIMNPTEKMNLSELKELK